MCDCKNELTVTSSCACNEKKDCDGAAAGGAIAGAVAGAVVAGPVGAAVGFCLGALAGDAACQSQNK